MSERHRVSENRVGDRSVLGRVRNPEYTGENRCTACTAVNLLIAGVLSAAVAWAWSPVSAAVGFLGAVATIGVRGYLVPGTPTLTERYLPDRVLAFFDGHETPSPADDDAVGDDHATADDVEGALVDRGVLEPCAEGADLCLAADVRDAWRERIGTVGPDSDVPTLLRPVTDVDPESVTIDTSDGGFAVAAAGDHVGRWPSRAAFLADVTAAAVLADELARWDRFSRRERSFLLAGLRLFLDVCPACGGEPTLERRTEDSCCRSRSVTVMACDDCDARLVRAVGT